MRLRLMSRSTLSIDRRYAVKTKHAFGEFSSPGTDRYYDPCPA